MPHASNTLPTRRVAIAFDGVPLAWHPDPGISRAANMVSFAAVTFERRLCATFREALDLMDTFPIGLRHECTAFIAQEATHSRLHKAHLRALEATGLQVGLLQRDLDALAARYLDPLPLLERLAFGALVEGWLAPLGHYLVAERETLFGGADVRVASLFLWHFCEEIEHRSTAHALYKAMGGTWSHRTRLLPRLYRLHREGAAILDRGLASAGQPSLPLRLPASPARTRLVLDLVRATGPTPPMRPLPDWAARYLHRIQSGTGPVEAWTGEAKTGPHMTGSHTIAGAEVSPRSRAIPA